jgi:hypothetical protein
MNHTANGNELQDFPRDLFPQDLLPRSQTDWALSLSSLVRKQAVLQDNNNPSIVVYPRSSSIYLQAI